MKKCILLLALLCGMVGCARTGDESAALPDIIETGENRLVDTFEPPDTAEVSSESAEPTTEPIAETAGPNERLPLKDFIGEYDDTIRRLCAYRIIFLI